MIFFDDWGVLLTCEDILRVLDLGDSLLRSWFGNCGDLSAGVLLVNRSWTLEVLNLKMILGVSSWGLVNAILHWCAWSWPRSWSRGISWKNWTLTSRWLSKWKAPLCLHIYWLLILELVWNNHSCSSFWAFSPHLLIFLKRWRSLFCFHHSIFIFSAWSYNIISRTIM